VPGKATQAPRESQPVGGRTQLERRGHNTTHSRFGESRRYPASTATRTAS
jgi:hypothetical protein